MASNSTKFHDMIREGWIVLLLSISLITSCILIFPKKPFWSLDGEATNIPARGLFGIQEHKHLEAINRQYPNLFSGHILTTEDFLKSFQEFLVLNYANYTEQCSIDITGIEKAIVWEGIHCPQWVEKHLLNNPSYEVVELGEIYGQVILRVRARD